MSSQQAQSAEEKFQQENGMTVAEAWEKVKEWNLSGKKAETQRGCEIILKYFPEHEAKEIAAQFSQHSTKEHSTAEKMGGKLAGSFTGFFQKKKKHHEEDQQPDKAEEKVKKEASTEQESNSPVIEKTAPPNTPALDDERLFATISYAWIFCIIPLLMRKESVFVQFHAKQGLVMAIGLTIFDFTIGLILGMISGGFTVLLKFIYLGLLGFAAYSAYQGKYWKIPVVYGISEKIKL